MMRDDGAFFGKSFYMLRFLFEIALGNKQRKVGILVTRFLEPPIERPLHVFPDTHAPGFDHHAPTHRRNLSHIRCFDHLLVPLGIIVLACRGNCGFCFCRHRFLVHCENSVSCGPAAISVFVLELCGLYVAANFS